MACVAFALEDDYYTSTKFLGWFPTFGSALNHINDKFEDVKEQPNDKNDWVYCDKRVSNTDQFKQSTSYTGCIKKHGLFIPNKWNIVIVELKETK